MKKGILVLMAVIAGFSVNAQKKGKNEKEIWTTIQDAQEKNKTQPKKMLVDTYTDWCGWCKKMDATTFKDPEIKKYLEEHFYNVKFNAETSEEIEFNGKTYKNQNPGKSRSTHDLAMALLNNRPSYPTFVFLDEKLNIITPVSGYMEPGDLEPVLHFIAEDRYKTEKWEDFRKNFKGKCKQTQE
jgi:thioredoxin-related protein